MPFPPKKPGGVFFYTGKDVRVEVSKFYCMVRMTFLEKLAYTKAVWFNTAGTLASIFIYYFLWKVVFMGQNELSGFTMAEITTYVILSKILSSQFAGGINMQFAEWIYEGSIGTEMLRPVTLFYTLFTKRVGEFAYFVLFKGLPILMIAFLILGGVGPAGVVELFMFFISVILALVIMFYFEFMTGLCSFYTMSRWGMGFAKSSLLSILSGGVVPLFLFPAGMAKVLDLLPFAGMVSVPIHIFLGKYSLAGSVQYLGLQVFWCAAMAFLAHLFFAGVIKKVIVQGG